MPKNGEDEKFRSFFTHSVADIPEKMTRQVEEDEEDTSPRGLLQRLRQRSERGRAKPSAGPKASDETGEIRLDKAEDEPVADLELAKPAAPAAPAAPFVPAPEPENDEDDYVYVAIALNDEAEADADPEDEVPAAPAEPEPAPPQNKAAAPQPAKRKARRAARPVEETDPQLSELMAMVDFARTGAAIPAQQPAAPQPAQPEPAKPAAEPAPQPQTAAPQSPAPSQPVFAFAAEGQTPAAAVPPVGESSPAVQPAQPAAPQAPAELPAEPQTPAAPRLFGTQEEPAAPEDTMSLPLLAVEDEAPAAPARPPEEDTAASTAHDETPQVKLEAEETAEPETPELVAERLKRMSASLTLRCALSGVLALVLLHLGLTAEGLVAPLGGLDPVAAPTAFYAADLLLLAAAAAVGYSVLRDGLTGLRGTPSSDTMPALATVAALIQAAVALGTAESYAASSLTLLSGIAALGLFMALLGSRVQLAAVSGGFELLASGVEQQGAYRVRDKDAIRALARDLEPKDPWVLLSRPVQWDSGIVDQCFGTRAAEYRTRKVAYVLLAAAVLSGLLFLLFGAGAGGAAAAMTAVLCMGAPLSSTLIAGIASLRLQRTAAAVGAMVPGWAAIEELGGVDTVQVDADELFTADCVELEDIRIFKGGRIDRAILYAASVLGASCSTLRGLFRQIIEDRTDILFPVKDFELHRGLGFSAWCDNNRILIGSRAYMEREGVLLPEQEYEDRHSQNGALQILYLAVSGDLHAMFVLRYQGGRNAARGLAMLQRENIRLLVSCQDPSLTARHITEAYRLPEGMVVMLDGEQCAAVDTAARAAAGTPCCMVHLKGFVSLAGGLRAAEQAQTAETSATTVQLVSVLFSVLIAALLTSAGSIGTLSAAAVLMYQAAWSALSIAVCALKQHR